MKRVAISVILVAVGGCASLGTLTPERIEEIAAYLALVQEFGEAARPYRDMIVDTYRDSLEARSAAEIAEMDARWANLRRTIEILAQEVKARKQVSSAAPVVWTPAAARLRLRLLRVENVN